MEPKAKQINPSIREDLRRVELSITNSETLDQVNKQELQAYKAIVDEIFGKKIDVTRIDTSDFED